jgi:hypothetical protein
MLHDDDRIDADFIETCVSAIHNGSSEGRERVGYVRTGVRLIDEHGRTASRHPNGAVGASKAKAVLRWMECETYWAFASTLFNTRVLREIGGFSSDFSKACEIHAIARIALGVGGIELEPIKASFRKHEGTLTSHTPVRAWVDTWYRIHEQILEWAPSPAMREQLRRTGSEFFSRMCYDLVSGVDNPLQRYMLYLTVYSRFGGRYLPPGIRKSLRRVKNTVTNQIHSQEMLS